MEHGAFGHLVRTLSRLPGLGPRSARRMALHLLTDQPGQVDVLVDALRDAAARLKTCSVCGNLDDHDPCHICTDSSRAADVICVVAGVADIWAIERTHQFKGRYHVLGGILSAIDGVTPDDLRIAPLIARAQEGQIAEIVLALPATVDGQATTHYLHDCLVHAAGQGVAAKMTRLALGLPMGGELDYMDDGTIAAAYRARAVL